METPDTYFFNCIIIEEDRMEREQKEYEKEKKKYNSGHSGGGFKSSVGGANSRPVDVGEADAPEEDQGMLDMFNRLRGEE